MLRPDVTRLAEWFVEEVCAQPNTADVHAIWSRLLEDPWIQRTLKKCSVRAAEQCGLSDSWRDDVVEDVVLRLHERLTKDPTLDYRASRGTKPFSSFMRTSLFHMALQAANRIRRRTPATQPVLETDQVIDGARTLAQKVDLNTALRGLPNELRAVAFRLAKDTRSEKSLSISTSWKLADAAWSSACNRSSQRC